VLKKSSTLKIKQHFYDTFLNADTLNRITNY